MSLTSLSAVEYNFTNYFVYLICYSAVLWDLAGLHLVMSSEELIENCSWHQLLSLKCIKYVRATLKHITSMCILILMKVVDKLKYSILHTYANS